MRTVIFGAGNVGLACAAQAQRLGHYVQVLDREGQDLPIGPVDVLLLCAGPTGDFRQRVLDTFDAAVAQPIRLMRALRPKRVVAVSSVRLYGFSAEPIAFDEASRIHTDHQSLDFAYDGAKQALENLMRHGAKELGSEGMAVRLSNVIGGQIRPGRGAMLHHALRDARGTGQPVVTPQHVASSKDYVDVGDAASGILLAATRGVAGEFYNIASGVALSVQAVADYLGVKVSCSNPDARPQHSRISIDKAKALLGYTPIYDNEPGIVTQMLS